MKKKPSIALVYDRVNTPFGGAEKVLLALHELYPQAPLYTAVYEPALAGWATHLNVKPSFLQQWRWATRHHRWLAFLMPLAFESFDLSAFDIVISISSAEAKGVITKPHQLHLSYLLTPTRYLYSHREEYLTSLPQLVRPLAKLALAYLTWWDQVAAQRPDVIIPISELVQKRVERYYQRTSEPVLYPPIALDAKLSSAKTSKATEPHYLVVSRLVEYKRVDLAIAACHRLQRPLTIVGEGPAKPKLEALVAQPGAESLVTFLDRVPAEELSKLYQSHSALLMPGLEDFGITALEAVAAGLPVIVHRESGAAELIEEGKTGFHILNESTDDLVEAIHMLEMYTKSGQIDQRELKQTAQKYATTVFQRAFSERVTTLWDRHQAKVTKQ